MPMACIICTSSALKSAFRSIPWGLGCGQKGKKERRTGMQLRQMH